MGFCGRCGSKLNDSDAFCPRCGSPTGVRSSAEVYEEASVEENSDYKCPQCGEPLPAFSLRCPICGFEPRGKKASSSISALSRQLDDIEAERPKYKRHKKRAEREEERTVVGPYDQRKVTLIQSYPIPTTKEDLVEFVLLSASNVNPKTFAETAQVTASERAISTAWYSKMCQAYEKSQLVLRDDPSLSILTKKYEAVTKAVKKNEKKTNGRAVIVMLIVLGLIIAPMAVYLQISTNEHRAYLNSLSAEERLEYDIEQEEKDCKGDETSIRYEVENGNYEKARNKVYTIDFDKELSQERHDYWENRKTELLEMIDEAQEGKRTKVGE